MSVVDLNQDFTVHERTITKGKTPISRPLTVADLIPLLRKASPTAPVLLWDDEEGNTLHHLFQVQIGDKDGIVLLLPAGEDCAS